MKPIILYYPVGTVHMRNIALLSGVLPEYDFRVFYDLGKPWFSRESVKEYGYSTVLHETGRPNDSLFDGDVRSLILSIAAIHPVAIDLVEMAFRRDIPVLAIEEVNQLALNQGAINHYLLPVDHLLVASDYERMAFEDLGIRSGNIRVTGWPFHSGRHPEAGRKPGPELRDRFGIPAEGQVVTLFLSALKHRKDASTLETPEVRRRLLETVRDGIPDNSHLLVKLHPIDDLDTGRRDVESVYPAARTIAGNVPVENLLDVTDICLNRGNSQVIIQALLKGIPTFVIPCGIRTVFHDFPGLPVVHDPEDLKKAVQSAAIGLVPDYSELLKTHMPFLTEGALERTAAVIREIAEAEPAARAGRRWTDLVLYRGMIGDPDSGMNILRQDFVEDLMDADLTESLGRWLEDRSTVADMEIIFNHAEARYQRPLVLSGWIRQLSSQKRPVTDRELAVIEGNGPYPPPFNTHNYVAYTVQLADLYLDSGNINIARKIADELTVQYGILRSVKDLRSRIQIADGQFNAGIAKYLVNRTLTGFLKPLKYLKRRINP